MLPPCLFEQHEAGEMLFAIAPHLTPLHKGRGSTLIIIGEILKLDTAPGLAAEVVEV